jgi:hypothetical protein
MTKLRHAHNTQPFRRAARTNERSTLSELRREPAEAREEQAATAEVLKAINCSNSNLQSSLDTIVQTAARLRDADFAMISEHGGASRLAKWDFELGGVMHGRANPR